MEQRFRDGDNDFKPNTRTYTSVIDAWAKSGEKGAARRAEQILNTMQGLFKATGDSGVKPNVLTANAVCNVSLFCTVRTPLQLQPLSPSRTKQACAFTKIEQDKPEALEIAFRVFNWITTQPHMQADAYTYTILLSVCSNLLPREDRVTRFNHARSFFESCCKSGHVNDYVLRKLRQTVTDEDYHVLVEYRGDASAMPASWTRNTRDKDKHRGRKGWTQRHPK